MEWQAIGMFVGTILGPSLGGLFYDLVGHYAVFASAYLVLLVDVILRFVMVERKVARDGENERDHSEPILPKSRQAEAEAEPGYGSMGDLDGTRRSDTVGPQGGGSRRAGANLPIIFHLIDYSLRSGLPWYEYMPFL